MVSQCDGKGTIEQSSWNLHQYNLIQHCTGMLVTHTMVKIWVAAGVLDPPLHEPVDPPQWTHPLSPTLASKVEKCIRAGADWAKCSNSCKKPRTNGQRHKHLPTGPRIKFKNLQQIWISAIICLLGKSQNGGCVEQNMSETVNKIFFCLTKHERNSEQNMSMTLRWTKYSSVEQNMKVWQWTKYEYDSAEETSDRAETIWADRVPARIPNIQPSFYLTVVHLTVIMLTANSWLLQNWRLYCWLLYDTVTELRPGFQIWYFQQ